MALVRQARHRLVTSSSPPPASDLGQERAREFLERQAILTVGWDQELADAAALAFQRFGKGRHPSGLNFGDCFSYALAQQLRVPLLFVGNDFSQTDLEAALEQA